jgi:hypothetical protein
MAANLIARHKLVNSSRSAKISNIKSKHYASGLIVAIAIFVSGEMWQQL